MDTNVFAGKRVLITGGTGSLGHVLLEKLVQGTYGKPEKIVIFSRDEAKQHFMRVAYSNQKNPTEDITYYDFKKHINFIIGDIRNFESVCSALKDIDIVINAAALKQVPSCEYFAYEACMTNVTGAHNIVRAISLYDLPVECVVGVTTDKACLPINVMGMTKALQERVFISANLTLPKTRFICVRYGNVLASRGSVIPLFREQIQNGGPVTITTPDMTRFLLPLAHAVQAIATAIRDANPGETYVPKIQSARIVDVAAAMIGTRKIKSEIIGIRPGEKIHELMISPEEGYRTYHRGDYFAIAPMLPELHLEGLQGLHGREYTSNDLVMTLEETTAFLDQFGLLDNVPYCEEEKELLM